jgi:hypothetical protein
LDGPVVAFVALQPRLTKKDKTVMLRASHTFQFYVVEVVHATSGPEASRFGSHARFACVTDCSIARTAAAR